VPIAPIQFTDSAAQQGPRAHDRAAPVLSAAPQQAHTPQRASTPQDDNQGDAARMARARHTPMVEVEVVHERGRAPRSEPLKRCYEIWTQNTIYVIDSRMRCIEVRSVVGGETKDDHPFVAARLVGGQMQSKDSIQMSYPLPRPGSFAVFESRKGNRRHFSRTSSVERVVLRLRIVTITDGTTVPSWDDFVDDT